MSGINQLNHTLRDYQLDVMKRIFEEYRQGKKSVCAVMPTGSGKTKTASTSALVNIQMNGGDVVWLAPLKELISQAQDCFPTSVHVTQVDETSEPQETMFPRIHISTVQSLSHAGRKFRPRAKFVVLDEAQYFFGTPEWNMVAKHYIEQGAKILSMTATPSRADGSPLMNLADSLVVGPTVKELIDRKFLVNCNVFSTDENTIITPCPVKTYLKYAKGTKAAVFCSTVEEASDLANKFVENGVSAGFAHSGNRSAVKLHKGGSIDVLCNVYLLSFGYDDPSLETVILNRRCGNPSTMLQMIGRALRPSEGKSFANFFDLYGVIHQYGFGLPTDDRKYSLDSPPICYREDKLVPGKDFTVIEVD